MKNGGSPSPCETFSNGEVEDYTVDFGNGPAVLVRGGDFELNIFPSPANEILNIQLISNTEAVNIKVYDALGRIIDEFDIEGNQVQIDVSKLKQGIYFVGADNGLQNTLKKFLKD
jgi:hypothetical protein